MKKIAVYILALGLSGTIYAQETDQKQTLDLKKEYQVLEASKKSPVSKELK